MTDYENGLLIPFEDWLDCFYNSEFGIMLRQMREDSSPSPTPSL